MDANSLLAQIRLDLSSYGDLLDKPIAELDPELMFARHVRDLDSYLSQGGTPPEAWTEGPDVPDEHIYVPEPLDFATEDGQTVGGFTVGADDPTPEVDGVAPEDEYRSCVKGKGSGWSCTRVAGHAGAHIAGTGHTIAAVWR